MFYRVGTLLNIKGRPGKVIGYIQYENPQDGKVQTFGRAQAGE